MYIKLSAVLKAPIINIVCPVCSSKYRIQVILVIGTLVFLFWEAFHISEGNNVRFMKAFYGPGPKGTHGKPKWTKYKSKSTLLHLPRTDRTVKTSTVNFAAFLRWLALWVTLKSPILHSTWGHKIWLLPSKNLISCSRALQHDAVDGNVDLSISPSLWSCNLSTTTGWIVMNFPLGIQGP